MNLSLTSTKNLEMGANSSSNLKLKAKIAEAVEHGDVAFASKVPFFFSSPPPPSLEIF